jgi:hypothetical protein
MSDIPVVRGADGVRRGVQRAGEPHRGLVRQPPGCAVFQVPHLDHRQAGPFHHVPLVQPGRHPQRAQAVPDHVPVQQVNRSDAIRLGQQGEPDRPGIAAAGLVVIQLRGRNAEQAAHVGLGQADPLA